MLHTKLDIHILSLNLRLANFIPHFQYYATTLRYIANDFFSNDELQKKKAKKALLDSVDQYCSEEIKKKGLLPK
jgi:hypothetical protein